MKRFCFVFLALILMTILFTGISTAKDITEEDYLTWKGRAIQCEQRERSQEFQRQDSELQGIIKKLQEINKTKEKEKQEKTSDKK